MNPIIIALDFDSTAEALNLIDRLGSSAGFYKIGMELYATGGMDFVRKVTQMGKNVFLDLKLYDIGETVKRATRQICKLAEPTFLTIHGSKSIMEAAVEGRAQSSTKLLAVTVLTSFDQNDLTELGYETTVSDLVEKRVRCAADAAIDGVICSPLEVKRVREVAGSKLILVTPGVRSAGAAKGDQKRIATPLDAIQQGADYLVIGRQVTRAPNPTAAYEEILSELAITQ